MKKKLVYRKLEYKGNIYYQLYKIVDNDEDIDVISNVPGKDIDEFYCDDIELEDEISMQNMLYSYYKLENDDFILLEDPFLINEISEVFYDEFNDFDIIKKNNFDNLKVMNLFNESMLFQEESALEFLNILKSNLDILDTDMTEEKKSQLKHNILLYGPKGFGKSTLMNCILKNITSPCMVLELKDDVIDNVNSIIAGLVSSAMDNLKQAENGIVLIKDNIDELNMKLEELSEEDDIVDASEILESILKIKKVVLGDSSIEFDLSKVTYVLVKNTSSDNSESLYDDLSQSVIDCFDEIICFKRLTKEQIKENIENNPNSSLNLYREACKKIGKELIIEPDFLDTLIERAYYDVGGIDLINSYIEMMIKTRWNKKKIVLTRDIVIKEVEDSSYLKDLMKDNNDVEDKEVVEKKEIESTEFKIDSQKLRDDYRKKLLNIMEYVKGQDEPVKNILYHALMNDVIQNSNLPLDSKKQRINHMLIRGGTGSGKSYITNLIAKQLNDKPFAEIDCKRYTESGYVGKSIDDMLIKLYYAAGGNLEKAQKGILFLDEIDKLSRRNGDSAGVSRGAVQESLLKLMEGTIFDLEIKEGHMTKIVNFDTRELTIIGAGAFEGLDKIRESRIKSKSKSSTIGFHSTNSEVDEKIDTNYTLSDMQEFGMDAQLLRRMPFQCDLNQLKKDDYRDIMLNSKSSAFKIKQERLEMLGVSLVYDEEFVNEFTNKVVELGFGVSGIGVLAEKIFSSFETKLLDGNYVQVILNKECVNDPKQVILVEKDIKVYKKQI